MIHKIVWTVTNENIDHIMVDDGIGFVWMIDDGRTIPHEFTTVEEAALAAKSMGVPCILWGLLE